MKRACFVFVCLSLTSQFLSAQSDSSFAFDKPRAQFARPTMSSPYSSDGTLVAPSRLNPPGVPMELRLGARDAFSPLLPFPVVAPGSSIFTQKAAYPSGMELNSVAVADVNGDGTPDEIVLDNCSVNATNLCYGPGVVRVRLGNKNGTFQKAQVFNSGGYYAIQVVTGDFNGDGKVDLAVFNDCSYPQCYGYTQESLISILLGNGDGTFQKAKSFSLPLPTSMVAGDVNGDGKTDLLLIYACDVQSIDCSNGAVDVYMGNGDATFLTPVHYNSEGYFPVQGTLADMNGDGKPDLLLANCGGPNCYFGTVSAMLNNGDGTFATAQTYLSGGVNAMAVTAADVNGDGKLDLLVDNYCLSPAEMCKNPVIGVLLGNGDGTLQAAQTYDAPDSYGCGSAELCPVSIAVADVNGDGKLDIVLPYEVLPGNGDGTFQTAQTCSGAPGSFVLADLNGDGRPDLSVADYSTNNLTILLNSIPWPTSAALSSSVNPSIGGKAVTFLVTVSSAAGKPTGKVTFMDGAKALGSETLSAGSAKFTTARLPEGSNFITAVYSGDSKNSGSTSDPLTQVVH
jgi:hypothetical protein